MFDVIYDSKHDKTDESEDKDDDKDSGSGGKRRVSERRVIENQHVGIVVTVVHGSELVGCLRILSVADGDLPHLGHETAGQQHVVDHAKGRGIAHTLQSWLEQ